MNTYEISVEVIFIVEAEDEGDAENQVAHMLSDVAYDWGQMVVE